MLHGYSVIVVLYKMRSNIGTSTFLSYVIGLAPYHAAGLRQVGLAQTVTLREAYLLIGSRGRNSSNPSSRSTCLSGRGLLEDGKVQLFP